MLQPGIKGSRQTIVTKKNTASAFGSGAIAVYGTPAMIALMEETSHLSIEPYLEEGEGSVGTMLNVRHVAATPIGMEVRCESELIEVDRRRLLFEVRAFDEEGLIGEGTHERFIINKEAFLEKTRGKGK